MRGVGQGKASPASFGKITAASNVSDCFERRPASIAAGPLESARCKWRCCVQGASDPVKVFDRTANLEGTQIINYRVDPEEKWCVLIGIAPGAPER